MATPRFPSPVWRRRLTKPLLSLAHWVTEELTTAPSEGDTQPGASGFVSRHARKLPRGSFLETAMRGLILAFAGGLTLAASAQAAPLAPNPTSIEFGAAPPVELVRDGCGRGWHRTRWRDPWGK